MEKVVISRSHHVKVGKDFTVVSAMQILRNAYPNCISFCYSLPGEGIFFGAKNKLVNNDCILITGTVKEESQKINWILEKIS